MTSSFAKNVLVERSCIYSYEIAIQEIKKPDFHISNAGLFEFPSTPFPLRGWLDFKPENESKFSSF
jgi:hypothetical protein